MYLVCMYLQFQIKTHTYLILHSSWCMLHDSTSILILKTKLLNSFAISKVDEGAILIPIADVVVSVFVPANPASQLKEICVVANMNADAMYLAPIASVKDLAFLALVDKSPQITISAPKVP